MIHDNLSKITTFKNSTICEWNRKYFFQSSINFTKTPSKNTSMVTQPSHSTPPRAHQFTKTHITISSKTPQHTQIIDILTPTSTAVPPSPPELSRLKRHRLPSMPQRKAIRHSIWHNFLNKSLAKAKRGWEREENYERRKTFPTRKEAFHCAESVRSLV